MFWDPAKHWIKKRKVFIACRKQRISKFECFISISEKWIRWKSFLQCNVIKDLPCKFIPKVIKLDPSLYILYKKIFLYMNVNWTKHHSWKELYRLLLYGSSYNMLLPWQIHMNGILLHCQRILMKDIWKRRAWKRWKMDQVVSLQPKQISEDKNERS